MKIYEIEDYWIEPHFKFHIKHKDDFISLAGGEEANLFRIAETYIAIGEDVAYLYTGEI